MPRLGQELFQLSADESSLTVSTTEIGPAVSAAVASGLSAVGSTIVFPGGLSDVPCVPVGREGDVGTWAFAIVAVREISEAIAAR